MPRMSRLEFLGVVRDRFPQIPVIVASAVPPEEMPAGVAAADYCCSNGSGFEPLLQAVSDLAQKPGLRTAPRYSDDKPVDASWGRDRNYVVGCEGCLRVFSFPRTPSVRLDEK